MAGIDTKFTKQDAADKPANEDTFGLNAILADTRGMTGQSPSNPHLDTVIKFVEDTDACVQVACDQIIAQSGKMVKRLADAQLPGHVLESAVKHEDDRVKAAIHEIQSMSPSDVAMAMVSGVVQQGQYANVFDVVAERTASQNTAKKTVRKTMSSGMMS